MTLPFAERVRRRMEERGLGLRELCRGVGLDPSFFSKVLAGKRSPPSEDGVLRRIAAFLELEPCELIVAAGRIPREWDRLWSDRPLLAAVDRLCRQGTGEPPRVPPKDHGKGRCDRPRCGHFSSPACRGAYCAATPVGPSPGRAPFGDELL